MGPLALIIGIILCLVAFGTDTAPAGTHNIGLMQQQMMLFHAGLALLIISAIRYPATISKLGSVETSEQDNLWSSVRPKKKNAIVTMAIVGVIVILVILSGR